MYLLLFAEDVVGLSSDSIRGGGEAVSCVPLPIITVTNALMLYVMFLMFQSYTAPSHWSLLFPLSTLYHQVIMMQKK